ncbi:MAG: hypothetical protein K0U84_22160 [Actinomycetia bacterium]|nr:hypothetical protein [Actinomycetes bacterium]
MTSSPQHPPQWGPPPPQWGPPPPADQSRRWMPAAIIGGAILIAGALVAGAVLINNGNSDTATTPSPSASSPSNPFERSSSDGGLKGTVSRETPVYDAPFERSDDVDGTRSARPPQKWSLPKGTPVTVLCQVDAAWFWTDLKGTYEGTKPFLRVEYEGGSGYLDGYPVTVTTRSETNQIIDVADVAAC